MKIGIAIAAILVGLALTACEPPPEGGPSSPSGSGESSQTSEPSESPSVGVGGSGTPIIKNDGGTVIRPDGIGIETGGGWHLTPDNDFDYSF